MQQYKTKQVFDPVTGLVKTDAKHLTMVEDYWLPRNASGKATEITTLPSGQNLGEMEEVNYMLQKLYKSLNVPITRLDTTSGFMIGRVTEISRDEVKFMKFIARLRRRFSSIFLDLLRKQLVLKGIMTSTEFDNVKQYISFEFASDNTFHESMQNEVMAGRLNNLALIHEYEGVYYSKAWIQRNILHLSEEDIEDMDKEIEESGGPKDDQLDAARGRVAPEEPLLPAFGGVDSGGKKSASINSQKENSNGKQSSSSNSSSGSEKSRRVQSSISGGGNGAPR